MKLQPDFLKKLDRYLLLNKHAIWATKIHYLLFYGSIAWAINWAVCHILPVAINQELPSPELWMLITGIPAGIGLCYWMHRVSKFSIEQGFGNFSGGINQLRFVLYFLGTSLMVAQPLSSFYWIQERLMSLSDPYEIQEDMYTLNQANLFYPSVEPDAGTDNIWPLIDCLTNGKGLSTDLPATYRQSCDSDYPYNYHFFESNFSEWEIGFGSYYEKHEYAYASTNYYNNIRTALSYTEPEQLALMEKYEQTMEKYGIHVNVSPEENLKLFKNKELSLISFEMKYELEKQMNYISYYATKRDEITKTDYLHLFSWPLVISFTLALLLQIYSAIGLRAFMISAASTLMISTGTIALGGILFQGIYPMMFMALAVYLLGVILTFKGRHLPNYHVLNAVSASFSGFFTPFLPFLIMMIGSIEQSDPTQALLAILIGCVVYALFAVPVFWRAQSYIQALPRSG